MSHCCVGGTDTRLKGPLEESPLQKGMGRGLKRQLFSSEMKGDSVVRGPQAKGTACAKPRCGGASQSWRGATHHGEGLGSQAGEEGGDRACRAAWVGGGGS